MHRLKRNLVRAAQIVASIALLLLLFVVWKFYLEEPTLAIWSHLFHGNTVAFQGHTMRLPLWWRAEESSARTLIIRHTRIWPSSRWGNMGIDGILEIDSPDPTRIGILDDKAAFFWQTQQVTSLQTRQPRIRVEARTVRSEPFTFYCYEVRKSGILACKPASVDWIVLFAGVGENEATKELEEAAAILRSVD